MYKKRFYYKQNYTNVFFLIDLLKGRPILCVLMSIVSLVMANNQASMFPETAQKVDHTLTETNHDHSQPREQRTQIPTTNLIYNPTKKTTQQQNY